MSLWGAGVFEGDDQMDFAAGLCEWGIRRGPLQPGTAVRPASQPVLHAAWKL
jgi:hypothetical protein